METHSENTTNNKNNFKILPTKTEMDEFKQANTAEKIKTKLENYNADPDNILKDIQEYKRVLLEEMQNSTTAGSVNEQVDFLTVQILKHSEKMDTKSKETFYEHIAFTPDDLEGFRRRYQEEISLQEKQLKTLKHTINADINGFAGIDPINREDLLEKITLLQNRVTYKVNPDDSYQYKLDDKEIFTDKGAQIVMAKAATEDTDAILLGIDLAKQKYGGAIEITGDMPFKERVIQIIVEHDIEVRFRNATQFAMYKKLKDEYTSQLDNYKTLHLEPGTPKMGTPYQEPETSEKPAAKPKSDTVKENAINASPSFSVDIKNWKTTQEKFLDALTQTRAEKTAAKTDLAQLNDKFFHFGGNLKPVKISINEVAGEERNQNKALTGITVIHSYQNNDKTTPTVHLIKGDGDYLQGMVKLAGKMHQIIAPLPATGQISQKNYLPIYSVNTAKGGDLEQIGRSGIFSKNDTGDLFVQMNINGAKFQATISPNAVEDMIAKASYANAKKMEQPLSPVLDEPKSANSNEESQSRPETTKERKTENSTEQKKNYLNVPFEDRDDAKRQGAKWDKEQKLWYCSEESLPQCMKWFGTASSAVTPDMIISFFESKFSEVGASLKKGLIADGNKHRIEMPGDKAGYPSGEYCIKLDSAPVGWIRGYREDLYKPFRYETGIKLNEEERKILMAQQAENVRQSRIALEKKFLSKSSELADQLQALPPLISPTQYHLAKSINSYQNTYQGDNNALVVPYVDTEAKLWSIQTIMANGKKLFAEDSKVKGSFHVIDGFDKLQNANHVVLCEGYSTGATLYEASKVMNVPVSVVVTGNGGNLLHVADSLVQKFPEKNFAIAGDDDLAIVEKLGYNPGKKSAAAAAARINSEVMYPEFPEAIRKESPAAFTDYNDLGTKIPEGMNIIKRQLRELLHLTEREESRPQFRESGYSQPSAPRAYA